MRAMRDEAVLDLLKEKPQLRLVLRTPDQILRLFHSDFTEPPSRLLTLGQLRALFAAMPIFRKDQEKQINWVHALEEAIEERVAKPLPKVKPILPKRMVIMPKLRASVPQGYFLSSLQVLFDGRNGPRLIATKKIELAPIEVPSPSSSHLHSLSLPS